MSYTSEQYKYLLMKRLQRHFSMKSAKERAYTQSFFWKLFDESVTVTEAVYNDFVSLMDEQIEYCAEHNVYGCADITQDMVDSREALLIDAFASIGITLEIINVNNGSGTTAYQASFTKPDGEVLVYEIPVSGTQNYFYINAKASCEYQYARASAPYYNMRDMEVPGADEIDPKIAGPGTYWSYDADTAAVTVTGNGAYAGATTEVQLGSGAYTTVIIGADVSRLLDRCLVNSATALVLLHPADGSITIDPKFNAKSGSCGDTYLSLDVYTDCEVARSVLSGEAFTKYITLHSLSEWEG